MAKRAVFGPVAALLVLIIALWARWGAISNRESRGALFDSTKGPVRISPEISTRVDVPTDRALSRAYRYLWPARSNPLGKVLHALRCLPDSSLKPDLERPTITEMQSVLLDVEAARKWYGGEFSLLETRSGVRYATSARVSAQAHVNQALSVLAELGIPLPTRLHTPEGAFTVADILADAVANFDLSDEIEWTAVSLALYLPPQRSWRNKFNEQFNFDDLTYTLMSRRLDNRSCAATHLMYSLALLFRVDRQQPILSQAARERLTSFLTRVRDQVVSHQCKNGAIEYLWFNNMLKDAWYTNLVASLSSSQSADAIRAVQEKVDATNSWSDVTRPDFGSQDSLVLSTGHNIEWLILLPAEMQPQHEFFERSVLFLNVALEEATESEMRIGFCPYCHATRAVKMLSVSAASSRNGR